MNLRKDNCYVITGGPGVGKTTLLHELGNRKYKIISENAREIIKQEIANNGDGLPWKNKARYAQLMLDAAIASYNLIRSEDSAIYFFDRGIADAICYADMIGSGIPSELDRIGNHLLYNKKAFMLSPWKEIYHTDSERKQTWEEAILTFKKMKATYAKYQYEIIEVPHDTVESRADFVLSNLG